MDSMGKTWVLDTETKGTGANMVPLEKVLEKPLKDDEGHSKRRSKRAAKPGGSQAGPKRRKQARPVETSTTPLPPGHVRKKATGEIGKVQAVDAQAGTVTVRWLKRGATSTVPLSAVARR
jgi:hypothetical protein